MNKIIAFDLDDVICHRPSDFEKDGVLKYKHCRPNEEVITLINNLYEKGFIIKIYTARGMTTFSGDVNKVYSNLYEFTIRQLEGWDVNFHDLIMGKIHYDLLIDDKALNSLSINSVDDILSFL